MAPKPKEILDTDFALMTWKDSSLPSNRLVLDSEGASTNVASTKRQAHEGDGAESKPHTIINHECSTETVTSSMTHKSKDTNHEKFMLNFGSFDSTGLMLENDLDAAVSHKALENRPSIPAEKCIIPVPLVDFKDRRGPWKNILVVGDMDTEKFSTINSIANYLLGVEFSDPFRYALVSASIRQDPGDSATEDVKAYHFYPMNPDIKYGLTIVDTPELGGMERDLASWQKIKSFVETKMPEIHAVCFTVRDACSRLSQSHHYLYSRLLHLFGEDIKENIFTLIAVCDHKKLHGSSSFHRMAMHHKGKSINFNNAAFVDGFQHLLGNKRAEFSSVTDTDSGGLVSSSDSESDASSNTHGEVDLSHVLWSMSCKAFGRLFSECLNDMPASSLRFTRDVLKEKESLENVVVAINSQIRIGLDTLECIRKTVDSVFSQQADLDANADFKIRVWKPRFRKVNLRGQGYTTTCLVCNHTCQTICSSPGYYYDRACNSLDPESYCTVCPGNCRSNCHKHLAYQIQHTLEEVDEVLLEKEEAAEAASCGISNVEKIVRKQRENYVATKESILEDDEIVSRSLERLRVIASRHKELDRYAEVQRSLSSEFTTNRKEPDFQEKLRTSQTICPIKKRNFQQRIDEMDKGLLYIDSVIQKIIQQHNKATQEASGNWAVGRFFDFARGI